MITVEQQIDALLEDLNKAERAGLVYEQSRTTNWHTFYTTDKMPVAKHRVLSAYVKATYPDVVTLVNGTAIHIRFKDI